MGGRGGSGRSSAAAQTAVVPAMSNDEKIFTAIRRSYSGVPGVNISSLTDVRKELARLGMTDREEQDRELLRMYRAREINLFPASNQKVLVPEDWAAMMVVGNERRLHIMIQ